MVLTANILRRFPALISSCSIRNGIRSSSNSSVGDSTAKFATTRDSVRKKLEEDELAGRVVGFTAGKGKSVPSTSVSRGSKKTLPKPAWLRAQAPAGENYTRLHKTVRSLGLATVCEEARCPNVSVCCVVLHCVS